jgi:hypothetical protein
MHEITVLKVQITSAAGGRQELVVDSAQALIGSGPHCEIRLPVEDAASEQLEVRVASGGVFGRVRSIDRPVLLDGVPFVEGRLLPESTVSIGSARLRLTPSISSLLEAGKRQRNNSGSRAIHVLGALGFPLGFALLFALDKPAEPLPGLVQPPPLFAATAEPCKESEPAAAAAFASRELLRAEAERERAPFDGGSGVRAVHSFQRAARCLDAAGERTQASEIERTAATLKRKVENAFHVHHVRLDRALATQRYDVARHEIALLGEFVGQKSGEYAEWLLTLDRNLELKFSGKK